MRPSSAVRVGGGARGTHYPDIAAVLCVDHSFHGHSNFSDGTGIPEDYFRYARDVAALDVVALTDHDHWGLLFLDQHADMWEQIRVDTRRFNEPGRFVTLLGFEWTSWIYGHRHVLFFDDNGPLLSSLAEVSSSPAQLWGALRARKALTVAHHSAGGPIATDWAIAPDPVFEPVTEVVSVHGSSEAGDSPGRIYSAVPGNFVRDALATVWVSSAAATAMTLSDLRAGEYVYVRVIQSDGGAAWSSPFFVE